MHFIKTTIVGGLFFIIPLILLIIIIEKALSLVHAILRPMLMRLGDKTIAGVALYEVIGIIILLLICFGAGLFARTKIADRMIKSLEHSLLNHLPGYQFIKSMGKSVAGFEEQDMKIVLARVDDGWQLSFLIEKISEDLYTVFVPDAPTPWSGSIYHLEKDKIIWTDITKKQAMNCIRQMGLGSAELLNKAGIRG